MSFQPLDHQAAPMIVAGVGNTSLQIGCLDFAQAEHRKQLPAAVEHEVFPVVDGIPEFALCDRFAEADWYVASVHPFAAEELKRWAEQNYAVRSFRILHHNEFPLAIDVDFPDRVGHDRLAAAVATNFLRQENQPAIFIDAGTALTINAIDGAGCFCGGAILPGAGISLKMLHQRTQQLPDVEFAVQHLQPGEAPLALGKNTDEAIRSGVYWGLVGAVRELVAQLSGEQAPNIFITGGFGPCLAAELGSNYQLVPHLVLAGVGLAAQELRRSAD